MTYPNETRKQLIPVCGCVNDDGGDEKRAVLLRDHNLRCYDRGETKMKKIGFTIPSARWPPIMSGIASYRKVRNARMSIYSE